ncbi:MAG TPA: phosphatase PAP2 family protein [Gemmatimonadaceae bacterium]|nr:phosphatase PAP2 family protein [Gemmatimonadaceae bacterium]
MRLHSTGTARGVQAARRLAVAVLLALPIAPLASSSAAAQPADTTTISHEPLFTRKDAIAAGVFTAATIAAWPLDKAFADYLQGAPQTNRWLRRTAATVETITEPGAFIIGGALYGIGRLAGNERMADLGLHGTEAIIIGLGVVTVAKVTLGRARPYVDRDEPHSFGFMRGLRDERYRSFPSGHSVMAFAAAAAVTTETKRWWPDSHPWVSIPMYGGATLVALSRMYDNKHWASDVIVGAMIGQFAGRKVVRYHHSHPDNRIDRWLLGVSIVPAPSGNRRMVVPIAMPVSLPAWGPGS